MTVSARAPRVLLDCDPGIDDALAIAYLAAEHRPGRASLAGVVCTAGNVGLDDTVRNALAWLDLSLPDSAGAPDVAVAAGAAGATVVPHVFTPETHGPRGAGYAELDGVTTRSLDARSGARLWGDTARAHPGDLVGVVTGPCSTLAAALELEPAMPHLLHRLVVMGGTFRGHPGNTTPVSEWNVDVDPEAADAVCLAWEVARAADPTVAPVWWCGLNLTERAEWTPERSEALLAEADTPLVRHLVDALRFYFEFHESVGEGYMAQVHDPLVAWLALHPGAALTERTHVRVECRGEHTRGMTIEDSRGHRGRVTNADLVVDLSVRGGVSAVLDDVARAIAGLG